ncbi:MAG: DNA-3-methyladenine glycosylase [Acidimicrobiia bacterium]|nr:DNA-3-methyladenine glycosylase [Acidimicrobiia bacterium]
MTGRARGTTLPRSFYDRDAREVAPELLNKLLVSVDGETGARLVARLVEVEAYAGADDAGSHAYRGRTQRNATMFGRPGSLYVYFTYGMHWCANAVCGPGAVPHAVLLRAAAPVEGLDAMRARRPKARRDTELCAGPARLTAAFGLDGRADGTDLVRGPVRGPVRIVDDGVDPPERPGVSVRIGISSGRGDEHPWRYYVTGDPHVSRSPR